MKHYEAQLDAYRKQVEATLDQLVPAESARPAVLHKAMRYSLEAGGKRLRPILLLGAHSLFPSVIDPFPAAAALECLHTYTLIHDDLPCMDNSDLRRGKPSCHKLHGETVALLAGDALLTEAFRILATSYSAHPAVATALIAELATAAGSLRLIGGQVEDTVNEGRDLSGEDLDYIHTNKTASLIAASLAMGVICTKDNADKVALARTTGHSLGLCFQIVDDLLDATSDPSTLGKTTGADAARGKNTYVKIHGIESSRAYAEALTQQTLDQLETLTGQSESFLSWLVGQMLHRKN